MGLDRFGLLDFRSYGLDFWGFFSNGENEGVFF